MQMGAVFGIIFALIVMALVLWFGSDQIMNIMCIGNIGQTSKDIMNLEALVDDIQASGLGSTDTHTMSIPSGAKICFLNPDSLDPSPSRGWNPDLDYFELIYREEIERRGINVWIEYNCGNNDPLYKMQYLVSDNSFCVRSGEEILLTNVDTNDGVRVRVESLN